MKKRTRYTIAAIAILVLATSMVNVRYREITWMSLGSGRLLVERKLFGFSFYKSTPQDTTISEAIGSSADGNEWLNVGESNFGILNFEKNNFCYPHILFQVGAVDRSFNNDKVTAITAKLALKELSTTKNPCALKNHLERFWHLLADEVEASWDDATMNSEMPRIWQQTS
jgi:hypothetical protein